MNVRRAALAGLLAGALDVAVGEIFAAALQWSGTKGTPSPVLAIGSAFVDRTPPWLKDFATSTFGTNDKTVLLAGMALVLAVLAAGIGVLAARNRDRRARRRGRPRRRGGAAPRRPGRTPPRSTSCRPSSVPSPAWACSPPCWTGPPPRTARRTGGTTAGRSCGPA